MTLGAANSLDLVVDSELTVQIGVCCFYLAALVAPEAAGFNWFSKRIPGHLREMLKLAIVILPSSLHTESMKTNELPAYNENVVNGQSTDANIVATNLDPDHAEKATVNAQSPQSASIRSTLKYCQKISIAGGRILRLDSVPKMRFFTTHSLQDFCIATINVAKVYFNRFGR
jgi:hypothetical protein